MQRTNRKPLSSLFVYLRHQHRHQRSLELKQSIPVPSNEPSSLTVIRARSLALRSSHTSPLIARRASCLLLSRSPVYQNPTHTYTHMATKAAKAVGAAASKAAKAVGSAAKAARPRARNFFDIVFSFPDLAVGRRLTRSIWHTYPNCYWTVTKVVPRVNVRHQHLTRSWPSSWSCCYCCCCCCWSCCCCSAYESERVLRSIAAGADPDVLLCL